MLVIVNMMTDALRFFLVLFRTSAYLESCLLPGGKQSITIQPKMSGFPVLSNLSHVVK